MTENEKIYQEAMSAGHSAAWDLQWDKAAEFYAKALKAKPNDYQALISLGLALYEQGKLDKALQVYAHAARIAPQEPVPWEKIGQIYERLGKPKIAVKAYLQAAERFMRQSEVKRGVENYIRVLVLEPENLTAHSRLALIYDRLKQIDKAAEEYLAIAALLQRMGKVQQALQAVKRALALLPNEPRLRRALISVQQGELLPKPQPPKDTGPLSTAEISESEAKAASQAAGEEAEEESADPVSAAVQNALSTLAKVLFERAEETAETPDTHPALASLVRGLTSPTARRAQHSRILLLIGQVVDLQTRGDFAQAAEELRRAVSAGLDHAAAYFDLGYLLLESDKPEEALAHLRRSALNPDYSLASHLLLARAYEQLGDEVEAARHALEALRLAEVATLPDEQADQISQLYEPIISELSAETGEEALKNIVSNVLSMLSRSNWEENVLLARQQLQEEQGGEALLPLAEMLLETDSGAIVEALHRVRKLLTEGHVQSALEEAELSLVKAPNYLPLHTLMGDILLKIGLEAVAEEKYLTVARTYLVRGNAERAVALYRKVLEINPMNLEAHSQLVDTLIQQNRLDEAVGHSIDLAEGYYRLADLDKAEQAYEEALRLAKRLPGQGRIWQRQILLQLADLAEQKLDWRRAASLYGQLRALEPENEEVRTKLIELYLRTGQASKAEEELEDYIGYMRQKGKLPELLAWLQELAETYPVGELYMGLGRLYAALGSSQQAIAAYDTAGEKFLDDDRVADAIRAVEAILALNPPNAEDYRQALAQLRESL